MKLHWLCYRNKILKDDKLLTFYNVSKDSTLEFVVKLFGHSTRPASENIQKPESQCEKVPSQIEKVIQINSQRGQPFKNLVEKRAAIALAKPRIRIQNDDDACQSFKDKLFQSRTVEMNKEVELKAKTFKKLEQQKVELKNKMTELENRKSTNIIEYEDRKGRNKQETKIMDQDIEKATIKLQKDQDDLAIKKQLRDDATTRQLLDSNKTDSSNKQITQEIGTLKRKMTEIEKEQGDLPKKQKVNEGLVEHISNMIEDKQKDLECPVCLETAETPIYQCTEGHLICKGCLPKINICPECREKYPKNPFRNRFAEKMDNEIKKLFTERKALLDEI